MKKGIFWGGLIIIWILLFINVGFNLLTAILGVLGSSVWLGIWGGIAKGTIDAKASMYLAKKYDEEKNKGK